MPRIKVQKPSTGYIKYNPRAFAIYANMSKPEEVDTKILEKNIRQYGDASTTIPNKRELTFEEFANLFSRKALIEYEGEGNCYAYGNKDAQSPMVPMKFTRRAAGPEDVRIQVAYCGICHSDIHQARDDWKTSTYPVIPGHEITGIVTEVGSSVTKFKIGDRVGVGCLVNGCRNCNACKNNLEQYCEKGPVFTYCSTDPKDGTSTKGGFSTYMVIDENFVLRIPDALSLDAAAPLLCSGITVYSPIRHYGLDKPGMKVGVMGLGGLGHMAVKFLKGLGVEVTVISTSPSKLEEATKVLGADRFVVSKDPEQMAAAANSLDGIINTISANGLDLTPYISLIKVDGKLIYVGAPGIPPTLPVFMLLFKRLSVGGSMIGGLKETQDMLDLCGKKNITSMIEVIKADYINKAFERVEKSDVRYRFVIDVMGSIAQPLNSSARSETVNISCCSSLW